MSIAASVLAQAKARTAAAPQTVVPLVSQAAPPNGAGPASKIHSRVDETPDVETGAPRLRVIIPGKKEPEVYDLSRLLVQPEIAQLLAEGFRQWAAGTLTKSRQNLRQLLNTNFGAFLETRKGLESVTSIDEAFWRSFVAWLNGPRKPNNQPWAPRTRALVLGAVKVCIDSLEGHPEHGAAASYLNERSGFPFNPWPGSSTKSVPTSVLSAQERRAMILACMGEIASLRERLEERDEILTIGRALLDEARAEGRQPPYWSEIGVCAAEIANAFPNRLASKNDLSDYDRTLRNAVQGKHSMLHVRRLLYATFRDLVPFVLLIGVRTAFNPDTILSLLWSQVRVSEDGATVTFLGAKNRSTRLQVSILPDDVDRDLDVPTEPGVPFGLAEILALLRRLTERTKAILSNEEHADRLFIGVPIWGGSDAKAIDNPYGPSSDCVWKSALTNFIQDHGLTPFTLRTLRFTEAQQEWRRTGDPLAVRDRLGHSSVATTRSHYTSDGMRREFQERVAETQTLYHRWAETEGRSDPRHQPELRRSAATPGFGCLNPYDSPRFGQRKGKLCTAYGECPDCPLAQAWPQNLQAAAWYLALPKAIHDARLGRISARHWVEKWKPILHAVHALLAEIPPEIRAEAARYHVKMKPVG